MIEAAKAAEASGDGISLAGPPGPPRYDEFDDYHRHRGPPDARNASATRTKSTHRLSPSGDEGGSRKRIRRAPRKERKEAARMEKNNLQSRP